MSAIETLLTQPAAQAVGWALLQFVWQGTAVGIVTALALVGLRRSASDVRYIVASVGLALMLSLPLVTGAQKYQALRSATAAAETTGVVFNDGIMVLGSGERPRFDRLERLGASRQAGDAAASTTGRSSIAAAIVSRVRALRADALLPTLMMVWLAGVTILSLRLLTGWIWVQRLRTRGNAPAAGEWQRMATRLSRRLHIRRAITLLESTLVDVPTVIGWLKPVVLLPASALAAPIS